MIEIKDLTMDYGSFRALDGLTLTIPQGEFFAFLGPNGAGKTTAIKLLTGLMKPVKGTVHLGGFDMQEQPLLAKALLGYVPDVAVFYEKLTPLEFMRFIADIFEMDEVKAEKTGAELFQKFSLSPYAHQRIENLSTAPGSVWPSRRPCFMSRKSSLSTSRWWGWTPSMPGR